MIYQIYPSWLPGHRLGHGSWGPAPRQALRLGGGEGDGAGAGVDSRGGMGWDVGMLRKYGKYVGNIWRDIGKSLKE